jgi:hypothetical protein
MRPQIAAGSPPVVNTVHTQHTYCENRELFNSSVTNAESVRLFYTTFMKITYRVMVKFVCPNASLSSLCPAGLLYILVPRSAR